MFTLFSTDEYVKPCCLCFLLYFLLSAYLLRVLCFILAYIYPSYLCPPLLSPAVRACLSGVQPGSKISLEPLPPSPPHFSPSPPPSPLWSLPNSQIPHLISSNGDRPLDKGPDISRQISHCKVACWCICSSQSVIGSCLHPIRMELYPKGPSFK